ncbi:MAG: hypothetical protein D6741_17705 [Planctomycetota bacterium]|nr:MAG: hypothetical protein D6741_17705 [Planctomycetota bacterium]
MSGLFAQLRTFTIRGRAPDDGRDADDAAPESIMVDLFEARERTPCRNVPTSTPIDPVSHDGSQGKPNRSAEPAASLRMPRNRPRTSVSAMFDTEAEAAAGARAGTSVPMNGKAVKPRPGSTTVAATQAEELVSQVQRLRVVREDETRHAARREDGRFDGVPTAEDGSILLENPSADPEPAPREVVGRPYHVNPYWRRTTSEALDLRRMIEERRRQLRKAQDAEERTAASVHHAVESRLCSDPAASCAPDDSASASHNPPTREASHNACDNIDAEESMREKLRSELMWVVQSWPRLSPQVRDAVLAVVRAGLADDASTLRSAAGT